MCSGIKDGVNVAAGQQFPLMCNENVDDLCFYIVMLMNPNRSYLKGCQGMLGNMLVWFSYQEFNKRIDKFYLQCAERTEMKIKG